MRDSTSKACHWINNGITLRRTRTSHLLKSVSPRSVLHPKPDRQTNKYICLTWYNMLVNIGSRDITIPSSWSRDVLWAVWLLLLNLIFLPQVSWKRRQMAFKREAMNYWLYIRSRCGLVFPAQKSLNGNGMSEPFVQTQNARPVISTHRKREPNVKTRDVYPHFAPETFHYSL